MSNALIFIASIALLLAASSIAALVWFISSGHVSEFQKGRLSIFDASEPIGEMTDSFPTEKE